MKSFEIFISIIMFVSDVMLFHIVPGTYFSEGVRDGAWLPTLSSEGRDELQVKVSSDGYQSKE